MDCPNCGHANAENAHFCGSCAAPLSGSAPCPACEAANPVGQRFCNECGHALSAAEPPEHLAEKIRAIGDALDGERKQVTVLFADVMGSMELAEQCDPEVWRRIMGRLFATLCEGAMGEAVGNEVARPHIQLALARVLLGSPGPVPVEGVEAALDCTLQAARARDARIFEPFVRAERAELARQTGDPEGHARELREAHRLFAEYGATGHAERLELELALMAS